MSRHERTRISVRSQRHGGNEECLHALPCCASNRDTRAYLTKRTSNVPVPPGVRLWDLTAGQPQRDLAGEFKGMYLSAAAYAPDGKLLALGRGGEVDGANGKVFLLDPSTGKKVRELMPGHQYGVTDLAFHPDGQHLASSGRDTVVRLWDVASGKLVKELGKPRGGQFKDWVHAIRFSADGRWLAAADMAGAVQVWSFAG